MAQSARAYTAGRFGLSIDGASAKLGWIKDFDGLHYSAEVVTQNLGTVAIQKKSLAIPKMEDGKFTLNFSEQKTAVWDWLQASMDGAHTYRDGAVHACDFDYKEMAVTEFKQALITEWSMPALDAKSKEQIMCTLAIKPETVRQVKGSGSKFQAPMDFAQKKFLCANFRVNIDGLDCSHINKVEGFSFKQKVQENPVGHLREAEIIPTALEYGNLKFTLSAAFAQSWIDWHQQFVIDGNNDEAFEKGGTIELLAPNMKDVLKTFTLKNLGINKISKEKMEANKDAVAGIIAEVYCEQYTFA
jgi:tail tube protein gp19